MPTLSGTIVETLKKREMLPYFAESLLNYNGTQVLQRDETDLWDYKERIDLDNPYEVAQLAKHILGFHNAKGGVLIVGVSDSFRVVGVPSSAVPDSKVVRDKIQKYSGGRVPLFIGRIDIPHNKELYLIFVPGKEGHPIPVAANGPHDKSNRPIIAKKQYYERRHGETVLCTEPADLERLFSGYSLEHLQAYSYDVDELYYRLLAPHCSQFIGRQSVLQSVNDALESRHPVVTLDGVGGVGKTAVAIQVARKMYESNRYLFIISVSAKSRVWHSGHIGSRQAGFAGLTEFLKIIAAALDVDVRGDETDVDVLKAHICREMEGFEGLLVVDNIESVEDDAVLHFLSREVPEPVKVLATSRIDKGLGGLVISVPEMTEDEARTLLLAELDRSGYGSYLSEEEFVQEILKVTGRIPLAIQWAASLTTSYGSLRVASQRLRKADSRKREFLTFCFATMFEELSPLARDVACLCPYFGDEWNIASVAVALEQTEERIKTAVRELKDRGILLASKTADENALQLLPLTVDFLANKWHENRALRDLVDRRLGEAIASPNFHDILLSWPRERRVSALADRARELLRYGDLTKAHQVARLALSWSNDPALDLLEGRILFELGHRKDGISRMRLGLTKASDTEQFGDEKVLLAEALMSYGTAGDLEESLELLAEAIPMVARIEFEKIERFSAHCLKARRFDILSELINRVREADEDRCLMVIRSIETELFSKALLNSCGAWLTEVLWKAARSDQADAEEKTQLKNSARRVGKMITSD